MFHKETSLDRADAVILPGGFAHGDYLRCGAMASFSPVAPAIREFASAGGPILGICNGFQVLTEMGLLPGALTRNAHLRFECGDVYVRTEGRGPFTESIPAGTVLRLPIAHGEGRYQCDESTFRTLVDRDQIAFRYCSEKGEVDEASNPNGARANIAGIYNEHRNVLGLMPHPERNAEALVGNADGFKLFASLKAFMNTRGGRS